MLPLNSVFAIFISVAIALILGFSAAALSSPAEDACEQGDKLMAEIKYQEAIPFFDRAIELNGKYPQAFAHLARAYAKIQKNDKALDNCNMALKLDPHLVEAYNTRASAYVSLAYRAMREGKSKEAEFNFHQAIDDFSRVISFQPQNYSVYISRSDAYAPLKEFTKAIADCTSAINVAPKESFEYAWAYQQRAFHYADSGNYKEAMSDCAFLVQLNRKGNSAFTNRAKIELDFQKYAEAVADYSRAIEIEPNDGAAYGWNSRA